MTFSRSKKPFIALPNKGTPIAELHIEIATNLSTCAVCLNVIQEGDSRFSLVLHVPEQIARGKRIVRSRYSIHSGCLTAKLGQEDLHNGKDECWDCRLPSSFSSAFIHKDLPPARLCAHCAKSPRWNRCGFCSIHYPCYMLVPIHGQELFHQACPTCVLQRDLVTDEQLQKEKTEFERIREQIAERGIFD